MHSIVGKFECLYKELVKNLLDTVFHSPKMFFQSFLTLVAVLVCATTSDIRYVRPADSPLSSCPGQPCLTLHEYVEIDNFTNGTTLQFLPGNHTLQQSLRLVNNSNVTLEAAFNHSVATIAYQGNVTIYCTMVARLHVVGLSFILSQRGDRSALQFISCEAVFISDVVFRGSGEVARRAIENFYSEATIIRCVFKGLGVPDYDDRLNGDGGAIYSHIATLTIYESSFINNVADFVGGAIFAYNSNLLLNEAFFDGNYAQRSGGAISCYQSEVEVVGNSTFHNNSCQDGGGALLFSHSRINIPHGTAYFSFNKAGYGGAVYLAATNTFFGGRITMLNNKAVYNGGALYLKDNRFISSRSLILLNNTAENEGGAIILYVKYGNVTYYGNITIASNTAKIGGGIKADRSNIHVSGKVALNRNSATYGGAINTLYGTLSFQSPTQFTHNTADEDGGAMFAAGTLVEILKMVIFSYNTAKNGGAIFLENGASLIFSAPINYKLNSILLTSSFNYAHQDGGGIYYRDGPSISLCTYSDTNEGYVRLPDCFVQLNGFLPKLYSENDTAEREGNFMFGGLMDRCHIGKETGTWWIDHGAISIHREFGSKPTKREISSKPYSFCVCAIDCIESEPMQVEVYRGQKFSVPLLAKMQFGNTSTIVTAITSSTARLETYQTSQRLPDYCTPLSYTVYSNESHEEVVLYPDGPCTGRKLYISMLIKSMEI